MALRSLLLLLVIASACAFATRRLAQAPPADEAPPPPANQPNCDEAKSAFNDKWTEFFHTLDVALDKKTLEKDDAGALEMTTKAAKDMFCDSFNFKAYGFPNYNQAMPGNMPETFTPEQWVGFIEGGFNYFRTIHVPYAHPVRECVSDTQADLYGSYSQVSWFPADADRDPFVRTTLNTNQVTYKKSGDRWCVSKWDVYFVVISEVENGDFYAVKPAAADKPSQPDNSAAVGKNAEMIQENTEMIQENSAAVGKNTQAAEKNAEMIQELMQKISDLEAKISAAPAVDAPAAAPVAPPVAAPAAMGSGEGEAESGEGEAGEAESGEGGSAEGSAE